MTFLSLLQQPMAHAITEALGWTLVHFLWQGALVALVLWCGLALTHRRSASARYAAGCIALAAMVILPAMTFARLAMQAYRMIAAEGVPIELGAMSIRAGDGPAPGWWAWPAARLEADMPWLMLAWCVGVLLFSCRLALGMMIARRLKLRQIETAGEHLQVMFEALRGRLGVRRAVALMHSAKVHVPTVVGWLKPVVLLPVTCLTGLSELQIEAVLAHELAHIRRNDYLVSVLQAAVEAVLFYHPAVWWVSRQIRRERECCCDELAVAVCGDRVAYARALSLLEESRGLLPELVIGANGGVLTMRIKRLLRRREEIVSTNLVWALVLGIAVAVTGGIVGIAYANAQPAPAASPGVAASQPAAEPAAVQPSSSAKSTTAEAQSVPTAVFSRAMGSEVQSQTQAAEGEVNEAQRQIERAERQIKGAEAAAAKVNSPELRKEIDEGIRQTVTARMLAGQARVLLNDPELKRQMDEAKAAAAKQLDSPEFKRQMREIHEKLNSPEFKRRIEEAKQQAERFNTPEFRERVRKMVEDARKSAYEASVNSNRMLAANSSPAAGQAPPPPPPPPPPFPPPTGAEFPPAPNSPVRVSSAVLAAQIISRTDPVYPAEARAARIQGTVELHAIIGKDGSVTKLAVITGPPELQHSAIDAVRQWIYKPFLLNGQPVEVDTTINVNYVMESDAGSNSGPQAQATSGSMPVVISSGSMPVVISKKVDPEYTAEARAAKVSGVVVVNLLVNKQGRPVNVHVVKGLDSGLDKNALAVVRQYRFKPAIENGQAIDRTVNIEVNYQIF